MILGAALVLASVGASSSERLADVFWDSCIAPKPAPEGLAPVALGALPEAFRQNYLEATALQIWEVNGQADGPRYFLIKATFNPEREGITRRCAIISHQWQAPRAKDLINARLDGLPYSKASSRGPMEIPGVSGNITILGGSVLQYDQGWAIHFRQAGRFGLAELERYSPVKAKQLLLEQQQRIRRFKERG